MVQKMYIVPKRVGEVKKNGHSSWFYVEYFMGGGGGITGPHRAVNIEIFQRK